LADQRFRDLRFAQAFLDDTHSQNKK
jgi:hypothetical protein